MFKNNTKKEYLYEYNSVILFAFTVADKKQKRVRFYSLKNRFSSINSDQLSKIIFFMSKNIDFRYLSVWLISYKILETLVVSQRQVE
jgi:hypothetical protein